MVGPRSTLNLANLVPKLILREPICIETLKPWSDKNPQVPDIFNGVEHDWPDTRRRCCTHPSYNGSTLNLGKKLSCRRLSAEWWQDPIWWLEFSALLGDHLHKNIIIDCKMLAFFVVSSNFNCIWIWNEKGEYFKKSEPQSYNWNNSIQLIHNMSTTLHWGRCFESFLKLLLHPMKKAKPWKEWQSLLGDTGLN